MNIRELERIVKERRSVRKWKRDPIPDDVLNGPEHELFLAQIFLQGTFPWYEWRIDRTETDTILNLYLRFLTQLPEFQLT